MSQLVVAVKVLLVASCFYPAGGQSSKPGKKIIRGSPNVLSGSKRNKRSNIIGLKEGGCPYGTMPIRRAPKRNGSLQLLGGGGSSFESLLIWVKQLTKDLPILRVDKNYTSQSLMNLSMTSAKTLTDSDICTAVIRTKIDPNKKFLGAEGAPATYKPAADGPGQWSAARMKLQNGPDSVEVGWMVNPSLFNDKEAHLYVRFTAGQTSCINTECPGFVHVGSDVPLGLVPDKYSQPNGQSYTWRFFIDKHEDDGNWWVSMDDDKYAIGYWPKSLFTGLANVATQVEWGGEVALNLQQTDILPQMGYGWKPLYDTKKTAYFQHVTVADEGHHNVIPENTEKFKTCPQNYSVLDAGYQGDYFGRLIFFGGPADN